MSSTKGFKKGGFGLNLASVKSLIHAPLFESYRIANIVGEPGLARRLREMGFHIDCTVRLLGRAPFNGPLIVQLHDSVLALRSAEAECLQIR